MADQSVVLEAVQAAWQAMSVAEIIAVALGLAYLLLAMRQNNACWYAAFGSTAIFSWLFWDVSLVMESALNVYYLAMAVYGLWAWRHGHDNQHVSPLPITRWSWHQHLLAMTAIAGLTVCSGWLLEQFTGAARPWLDSFTTWGAVITTWMVTRKILENWLYWLVIDSAAIVLYIDRELYLTAVLMALYVILAITGWFLWLAEYRQQQNNESQERIWQQA